MFADNRWDCDAEGKCCTGCGLRQEEFYGCADVTILTKTASMSRDGVSYSTITPTVTAPSNDSKGCHPVGMLSAVPGMTSWCRQNCSGARCRSTFCTCGADTTNGRVGLSELSTTDGYTGYISNTWSTLDIAPPSPGGTVSDGSRPTDATTAGSVFSNGGHSTEGVAATPAIVCEGRTIWRAVSNISEWCLDRCLTLSDCPLFICRCTYGTVTTQGETAAVRQATVSSSDGSFASSWTESVTSQTSQNLESDVAESGSATSAPPPCNSGHYISVHLGNANTFMDFYCQTVCSINQCPEQCLCVQSESPLHCIAAPEYDSLPSMNTFCAGLCSVGVCPEQCICTESR